MPSFLISLFITTYTLLALASPLLSQRSVHEIRTHTPLGWSYSHRHNLTSVLPLRFGLIQPNIHNIEEYLLAVSHPDSPDYGKHWTPAQVAKTFAPTDETVNTVRDWLLSEGFARERVRVTPTKAWIEVNATVEEAERLLFAEYSVYKHESGKEHVGTHISWYFKNRKRQ